MRGLVLAAGILAMGVAIGGLLHGGVYEQTAIRVADGAVELFRLNRFTGAVWVCGVVGLPFPADGTSGCIQISESGIALPLERQ